MYQPPYSRISLSLRFASQDGSSGHADDGESGTGCRRQDAVDTRIEKAKGLLTTVTGLHCDILRRLDDGLAHDDAAIARRATIGVWSRELGSRGRCHGDG